MKRTLVLICIIFAMMFVSQTISFGAAFTPGNIVVVRMGTGVGALGSTATAVFLDEYTPAGVLVQSIALPTTTSGSNRRVTASGSATSEGLYSLSVNGQYVTFVGYDTTLGTTGVASSTCARVIGYADNSGTLNSVTSTDGYSGNNIRGAVTIDATAFWSSGPAVGTKYTIYGASTGTQLSTTLVNTRFVGIWNGQLYTTSGSATFFGVNKVGTGLPTTSGQSTSVLFGLTSGTGNPSPYCFTFAPDGNSCYVADDRTLANGGGIQKWTFNGISWSLAYTLGVGVGTEGARGVTVDFSGVNPVIYATSTTASANKLVKITDGGALSVASTIVTASTNTVFRGILFAPVSANPTTKTNFTSVLTPQFLTSGDTSKLPVVFRATVSSLTPNTLYRYMIRGSLTSELGTNVSGAGNSMLISSDGSTYTYSSSPSLSSVGNYGTFTTDGSGNYTGWFSFINNGNLRYTAGNYVVPEITIDNAGSGVEKFHYALNDSIKVLQFSSSAGVNNGTGIYGLSYAAAKSIIALFDNTGGTGKPLAMTYTEDEGNTVSGVTKFYLDSVNSFSGRWGTMIPNTNSNGVRLVQQYSALDGSIVTNNSSPDGNWNVGGSTINPAGGYSAIRLDITDAPLPVVLSSFTFSILKNSVKLNWQTSMEINNKGFEVERQLSGSSNNVSWELLGFVSGKGNSNHINSYSYEDKNLVTGNYKYRLKQTDFNGNFELFTMQGDVKIGSPVDFSASQNYPNPFNPSTNISYSIAQDSYVQIRIFDITGRVISEPVSGNIEKGYHSFTFNGTDIASGIYFYQITAKDNNNKILFTKIKKMLLVK